jgi:hypothetical protein
MSPTRGADGALADLREQGVNDSGAVGEAVLWTARRSGDDGLQQAFDRQLSWLLVHGPRAADGTLFHLRSRQECWVDTPVAQASANSDCRWSSSTQAKIASTRGQRCGTAVMTAVLWYSLVYQR